jgi:hypothetical protein
MEEEQMLDKIERKVSGRDEWNIACLS